MSGTSADGIDAALVQISENPLRVALLAFAVFPYSPDLRERIGRVSSPAAPLREIGLLNVRLGEAFAKAAFKVAEKSGRSLETIDFIGSHGQTLYHHPPSRLVKGDTAFTTQIADGCVIAQRTGLLTVSDFRTADMACGGEGAPLVPYADWRLFSHKKKGRVLLNLGGIANFTYLPAAAKLDAITACDTGPGNALLDALVQAITRGKKTHDGGGQLAARGKVNNRILERLMRHPFLKIPPPKSAEKSRFGSGMATALLKQERGSGYDLLATACAFTAQSVVKHLTEHARGADEIYVSGGGAKNLTLMRVLRQSVAEKFRREIPIFPFDRLGIPAKAKEAVVFAFLAFETLKGRPSNVPNVTGAKRPCVLGKISPGWRKKWKLL